MDFKDWCPDEAVENLTVRRAIMQVEDPIRLATELLRENLPLAVMSITHLAVHSPTEAIRFNAAKYVVDRTMGDSKSELKTLDNRPAWEKIYDTVLVEANKIVNQDME